MQNNILNKVLNETFIHHDTHDEIKLNLTRVISKQNNNNLLLFASYGKNDKIDYSFEIFSQNEIEQEKDFMFSLQSFKDNLKPVLKQNGTSLILFHDFNSGTSIVQNNYAGALNTKDIRLDVTFNSEIEKLPSVEVEDFDKLNIDALILGVCKELGIWSKSNLSEIVETIYQKVYLSVENQNKKNADTIEKLIKTITEIELLTPAFATYKYCDVLKELFNNSLIMQILISNIKSNKIKTEYEDIDNLTDYEMLSDNDKTTLLLAFYNLKLAELNENSIQHGIAKGYKREMLEFESILYQALFELNEQKEPQNFEF